MDKNGSNSMPEKLILSDIRLAHISDVKTLVEKIYSGGSVFEFRYETRSVLHSVEFEQELYHLPKPIEIKITKFPNSKLVELYNKFTKKRGWIVIKRTTNKYLYFLLQNLQTGYQGYRSNNKFDRYKALYLVYEGLAKVKKNKFKAIRHSLSHPKLYDKKALRIVVKLFGDDKIDVNKRRHLKILQNFHEELLEETKSLMVKELLKLAKRSKDQIGYFVII